MRRAVFLIALVALAAAWGYKGSQWNKLAPPVNAARHQDLEAYLIAAERIRRGASPYDHALAFGRQPDVAQFITTPAPPYVYPPALAVALGPAVSMPRPVVRRWWTAASWLAVLLVPWFVVLALPRPPTKRLLLWACGAMSVVYSVFVHEVIRIGQIDVFVAVLLAIEMYAFSRRRGWSGLALGLAATMKPLVGPIALLFLWRRQWAAALLAGGTALVLNVVAFQVVGWHLLPDYLTVNRLWTGPAFLAFPLNQSPRAIGLRWFTENGYITPVLPLPWMGIAFPVVIGVGAAMVAALAVWRLRRVEHPHALEFAIALATLMLVSPLVENIHLVWALVAMTVLVAEALTVRSPLWFWAGSLALVVFFGYPSLQDHMYAGYEFHVRGEGPVPSSYLARTSLYFAGILWLYTMLVAAAFLRSSPTTVTDARPRA